MASEPSGLGLQPGEEGSKNGALRSGQTAHHVRGQPHHHIGITQLTQGAPYPPGAAVKLPAGAFGQVRREKLESFLQAAAGDPELVHRTRAGTTPDAISLSHHLPTIGLEQSAAERCLPLIGRRGSWIFHDEGLPVKGTHRIVDEAWVSSMIDCTSDRHSPFCHRFVTLAFSRT
jgi:hypothetical protein